MLAPCTRGCLKEAKWAGRADWTTRVGLHALGGTGLALLWWHSIHVQGPVQGPRFQGYEPQQATASGSCWGNQSRRPELERQWTSHLSSQALAPARYNTQECHICAERCLSKIETYNNRIMCDCEVTTETNPMQPAFRGGILKIWSSAATNHINDVNRNEGFLY